MPLYYKSIKGLIHWCRQNPHDPVHDWIHQKGIKPSTREPFGGKLHIQTITSSMTLPKNIWRAEHVKLRWEKKELPEIKFLKENCYYLSKLFVQDWV
jgi:hypothetical protein